MTHVHIWRGEDTETHTQEKAKAMWRWRHSLGWRGHSQRMARGTRGGKGKEGSSLVPSGGKGAQPTPGVSDFWLPERRENTFLLSSATELGVTCCCSPRRQHRKRKNWHHRYSQSIIDSKLQKHHHPGRNNGGDLGLSWPWMWVQQKIKFPQRIGHYKPTL